MAQHYLSCTTLMQSTLQNQYREPGVSAPASVVVQHPATRRPTFAIACWLLALLAFAQLLTVGAAITVRNKPSSVATAQTSIPVRPVSPRSLEDILASVGNKPSPASSYGGISDHTAPPLRINAIPLSSPVLATPPQADVPILPTIADPVVERLVRESRTLQLDGDIMRAMLKLDEAGRNDPAEPAVIYHKALLFEEMGMLIKATDHYQQVQQTGIKAGVYFKLAANKLTKGMDVAHARRSVISIGPMNTRKGKGKDLMGSENADVTITILARPDKPINPADVHVQIHFYDKVNGGEIKKASTLAQIKTSWGDNKLDWQDPGNEETLRISYSIPETHLTDEHLLGRREFYGYVVELLYKGEVIDQQAQPRRLHSVHSRLMAQTQKQGNLLPWLPSDDNSLLPGKGDHGYGDNPTLPPLPTR